MAKQTRERVDELGNMLSKKDFVVGTRTKYILMGGGDGHSFDDSPEPCEVPVYEHRYAHSRGERRAAVRELRKIGRTASDEDIRRSCQRHIRGYSLTYRAYRFFDKHPVAFLMSLLGISLTAVVVAPHVYDFIKKLGE